MSHRVRKLFASAASRYDEGNPLLTIERAETGALLPDLTGRDVLDLGCGTGHYAKLALAQGARMAVAVDITLEMLLAAPRPAILADAARLPLRSGAFDVVVAAMMISYVRDRQAAVREVSRVLRLGGVLIISDLHPIAADVGWQRTFLGPSGDGLVIEAPPASVADLTADLSRAGLEVEALCEPTVDARLEKDFRRARRKDFRALAGTPLLLLLRARKTGAHAG